MSKPVLLLGLALVWTPLASAQPRINLGQGFQPRLENMARDGVGQSRLIVTGYIDAQVTGPFVVSIAQNGREIASASCEAREPQYSGESQEGLRFLRECGTEWFPASSLATNRPADVIVAWVNDATDARTEIFRGSFPVLGFFDWTGMDGRNPVHVEQRALRLDSAFGTVFARQYMDRIQLTFATATHEPVRFSREGSIRCRVGEGEWSAYETNVELGTTQTVRNRVWARGEVREGGTERIDTTWVSFDARLPVAIRGRARTPTGGEDGEWTCELRTGDSGSRVVQRRVRFSVVGGWIQPHAIEAQTPAGRGAVLMAAELDAASTPVILDPAIVRGTLLGRDLGRDGAPITGLPRRATVPRITTARVSRRR